MIKSFMTTSARKNLVSRQMEIIDVSAENNLTTSLMSYTENYLMNFRSRLDSVLKSSFKEPKYEIMIVADENRLFRNTKVIELIALLEDDEQIKCVKDSLTEPKLTLGLLTEEPPLIETTEFRDAVQDWCNEIQKYLSNEYEFNGMTRIKAAVADGELVAFYVSNTGRGVNDDIVFVMKEMSKTITTSKNFGLYIPDKYSFIDSFFKS